MKTTYVILQLERLGKKQKKFIVRREKKSKTLKISSKVFGPTSLENCENFLKRLKNKD